jgi:hypothetical protein
MATTEQMIKQPELESKGGVPEFNQYWEQIYSSPQPIVEFMMEPAHNIQAIGGDKYYIGMDEQSRVILGNNGESFKTAGELLNACERQGGKEYSGEELGSYNNGLKGNIERSINATLMSRNGTKLYYKKIDIYAKKAKNDWRAGEEYGEINFNDEFHPGSSSKLLIEEWDHANNTFCKGSANTILICQPNPDCVTFIEKEEIQRSLGYRLSPDIVCYFNHNQVVINSNPTPQFEHTDEFRILVATVNHPIYYIVQKSNKPVNFCCTINSLFEGRPTRKGVRYIKSPKDSNWELLNTQTTKVEFKASKIEDLNNYILEKNIKDTGAVFKITGHFNQFNSNMREEDDKAWDYWQQKNCVFKLEGWPLYAFSNSKDIGNKDHKKSLVSTISLNYDNKLDEMKDPKYYNKMKKKYFTKADKSTECASNSIINDILALTRHAQYRRDLKDFGLRGTSIEDLSTGKVKHDDRLPTPPTKSTKKPTSPIPPSSPSTRSPSSTKEVQEPVTQSIEPTGLDIEPSISRTSPSSKEEVHKPTKQPEEPNISTGLNARELDPPPVPFITKLKQFITENREQIQTPEVQDFLKSLIK